MTLPVLSEDIYKNPAQFEYFIRFKIFLYTEDSLFKLELIQNSDLIVWSSNVQSYSDSKYLSYCGKVNRSETLNQAIMRELKNGFGIEKINKFSCNEKIELAKNRFGEILPRVVLNIDVDLKEVKKCILGSDLAVCKFISKTEEEKIKMAVKEFYDTLKPEKRKLLSSLHLEVTSADRYEDTYTMEALKFLEFGGILAGNRFENTEEAKKFVEILYDLGAEEVRVSSVRLYDDDDFIGTDELEVTLPKETEKRKSLLKVLNEEAKKEGFVENKSDEEKEVGQKIIEFWWD